MRDAAGVASSPAANRASSPRIGGISFVHRFGSALNRHVHLHACVPDGVFGEETSDAPADAGIQFIHSL